MSRLRIALAAGSLHLPQKHFVLDHAVELGESITPRLFTFAAQGIDTVSDFAVRQFLDPLPAPYDVRRRAYPWGNERWRGRSRGGIQILYTFTSLRWEDSLRAAAAALVYLS